MMTHDLSSNQGWLAAGKIIRDMPKPEPSTPRDEFERAWKGPQEQKPPEKKGPVRIPDLEGRD